MTDGEIHFDPVADGPPPRMDKFDVLFIGLWAALALLNIHTGDLTVALLSGIIGADVWFRARGERKAYFSGYLAAAQTVSEQLDAEMRVNDD